MTSRIQFAVRDERLVTLAEVQRGEKGLACYTCGDKLAVKDGGGRRVTGTGRRHQSRRKHFAHTANSKCHGEGPAHYHVKPALCRAINHALNGTVRASCGRGEQGLVPRAAVHGRPRWSRLTRHSLTTRGIAEVECDCLVVP